MRTHWGWIGLIGMVGAGCRPSNVLSVPAPAGVLASGSLQSQSGAEGVFNAGKAQLFAAKDGVQGVLEWSELLTDEFTFSGFSFFSNEPNIDARETVGGGGFTESADFAWEELIQARTSLLLSLPGLATYEPANARSTIGEAAALTGYAELLLAESFCAGTPLNEVLAGGGIQYGTPLTMDSLLGTAETHFDTALAEAHGNAAVVGLASVGLGRTLLDRGQYAAAAAAVQGVPPAFVYNGELEPNFTFGTAQITNIYALGTLRRFDRITNVVDGEGGNGLNFVSAQDPRLLFDTTTYQTTDRTAPWRLPLKFEADLSVVPLATGIEAQLIGAEAALEANSADPMWLNDLNALRNSGCTGSEDSTCAFGTGQLPAQPTGLLSLVDPGSDSARVSLLFRERAFWLFGTGTRLGDLRRLIRQYGRDQSTVFPTGPYANGNNPNLPSPLPNYGTDVDLTLPTPAGLASQGLTISNPLYKGCMTSTKTA